MIKGIYVLNAEKIYESTDLVKFLIAVAIIILFYNISYSIFSLIKKKRITKNVLKKIIISILFAFALIIFSQMPLPFLRYVSGYKYYSVIENQVTMGQIREYYSIIGYMDGVFILREK